MQFSIRALSPDNRIETVSVEGADEAEARRAVEARGWQAISIDGRRAQGRIGRAGEFSVLDFGIELVALLEAGLSVVEAIEALHEKEAAATHRALYARLLERLRAGQRLSQALRADGARFDDLFVGIVQAAERTSDLPRALSRYVEYGQRMQALRARVLSASIYPAILLLAGGAVALFLMGYVVPRFAAVYQDSGRTLPTASRLLLDWGQWVGSHAGLAAAGAAAALAFAVWALRSAWRSGRLVAWLARAPLLGEPIRVARLARMYLTLGMLLEGGIAIVPALDMLRASSPEPMARALAAVRTSISAGEPLSRSLEAQSLATSIALRLLRVGERSGQLGAMLGRAAAFHEAQTARWIERFSRVFEPLLMALIGLVVGTIVILLYMPIFDLAAGFG